MKLAIKSRKTCELELDFSSTKLIPTWLSQVVALQYVVKLTE